MLDTPATWRVEVPPDAQAGAQMRGRPVAEARDLLGRLTDHSRAAQRAAFDIATGSRPDMAAVTAETRRDHLIQIFTAWPRALGLSARFDRAWLTDDRAAHVALFGAAAARAPRNDFEMAGLSRRRGWGRPAPLASSARFSGSGVAAVGDLPMVDAETVFRAGGGGKLARRAAGRASRRWPMWRRSTGAGRSGARRGACWILARSSKAGLPADRRVAGPRHRAHLARRHRAVGRSRERPCHRVFADDTGRSPAGARRRARTDAVLPAARTGPCCCGPDDDHRPLPPRDRGGRASRIPSHDDARRVTRDDARLVQIPRAAVGWAGADAAAAPAPRRNGRETPSDDPPAAAPARKARHPRTRFVAGPKGPPWASAVAQRPRSMQAHTCISARITVAR